MDPFIHFRRLNYRKVWMWDVSSVSNTQYIDLLFKWKTSALNNPLTETKWALHRMKHVQCSYILLAVWHTYHRHRHRNFICIRMRNGRKLTIDLENGMFLPKRTNYKINVHHWNLIFEMKLCRTLLFPFSFQWFVFYLQRAWTKFIDMWNIRRNLATNKKSYWKNDCKKPFKTHQS